MATTFVKYRTDYATPLENFLQQFISALKESRFEFACSMFNSSPVLKASTTLSDAYDLADKYGLEATTNLSCILQALESAGFCKAQRNSYSAFDRVLCGIAWLLQRIVKRENAGQERVQWDLLYQSHTKMKSRLGLAQEVLRCIEALHFLCPVAIQPHQLLLQDFGDIETVHKLVLWLIREGQDVQHLEEIRHERAYLKVLCPQNESQSLVKEVETVLDAFAPRRRWQFIASEEEVEDSEDALIQRCLLEYGERATDVVDEAELSMETNEKEVTHVDIMAQIASQAAEIATTGTLKYRGRWMRSLGRKSNGLQAVEFNRRYLKAMKQATEAQQVLVSQHREREAKILQHVILIPNDEQDSVQGRIESSIQSPSHLLRVQLKEHDVQVRRLIQEKKNLNTKIMENKTQAAALDETLSKLKLDIAEAEEKTPADGKSQAHVAELSHLVIKNEVLKREKNEVRNNCRVELEALRNRIEKLRLHVTDDASVQGAGALRLAKIKQSHVKMAVKHKDMRIAAAKQDRALHLKMKQIDEIPTRFELVQYEKRFLELYNEVALTLDETRKYYCVYNTLKTTHEFLEKEVSLLNSISENIDVAMASKTATQAFFMQTENIIQNVQSIMAKQQSARNDHQADVETLDGRYQFLLEQERLYVNAIRKFQKECEKNERLAAQLEKSDQN